MKKFLKGEQMLDSIRFISIIFYISFIGHIGGTIYIAVLPELSQFFHVSSTFIKFSITIYFIGLILGTILSGLLSEAYGRFRAISFFLFLSIVGCIICIFSSDFSWFLLGRILQGTGQAGGPILAISLVADRYNGLVYRKIMSFILIIISMGPGLSPVIGSVILEYFNWKFVFYFMTFLEILGLIFIFFLRIENETLDRKSREIFRDYISLIKHPLFRYYCFMIGSLYGAFYAFFVLSPYIFRLHYGWRIIDFVWVGMTLAIANSLGSFLEKELIEKMEGHKVFLCGFILMIISFLLLICIGMPEHGMWILLIVALFLIGDNLISTWLTTEAIKIAPQFTSIASSFVFLAKISLATLVLVLVLLFPETMGTVKLFIFFALVVFVLSYLKLRKIR